MIVPLIHAAQKADAQERRRKAELLEEKRRQSHTYRRADLHLLHRVVDLNSEIKKKTTDFFLTGQSPIKSVDGDRPGEIKLVFVETFAAIVEEARAWEDAGRPFDEEIVLSPLATKHWNEDQK